MTDNIELVSIDFKLSRNSFSLSCIQLTIIPDSCRGNLFRISGQIALELDAKFMRIDISLNKQFY